MRPTHAPTLRPPQQTRSQDTLDRMLNATEVLLADRTFEELTIADVVRKSRSSVGAFYARFANKDALFDALYDRHQQQMADALKFAREPEHWRHSSLTNIVSHIVHVAVDMHYKYRGLLRALVLRGYVKPDPRYRSPKERNKLSITAVGSLIASRRREIGHPDPQIAASLGFLMVLATLREKLLFGDSTASALRISRSKLESELVRAFLAYLDVRPALRRR